MASQITMDALFGTPAPARPVRRPARRAAQRPADAKALRADATPKPIRVVVTPADFDHRTDRLGRGYAFIRGTVTHRKADSVRTVMAQGGAYHLVKHLLGVGASIEITAIKDNVRTDDGRQGGSFFRLQDVIKVFDAEGREIDGTTGERLDVRTVAGHERKGHYRQQHYGPRNSLVRIIWVDDVKVNGGRKAA